jgi:hypothetical protein
VSCLSSWAREGRSLIQLSISSLLIIAGQESGAKFDFGKLLLEQVEKLREQIDDEEKIAYVAIDSQADSRESAPWDEAAEGRAEPGIYEGARVEAGQKVFGGRK